jgi:hypothetical protein
MPNGAKGGYGTYIVVKGTAAGKLEALFGIWREILLNESNLGTRGIPKRRFERTA